MSEEAEIPALTESEELKEEKPFLKRKIESNEESCRKVKIEDEREHLLLEEQKANTASMKREIESNEESCKKIKIENEREHLLLEEQEANTAQNPSMKREIESNEESCEKVKIEDEREHLSLEEQKANIAQNPSMKREIESNEESCEKVKIEDEKERISPEEQVESNLYAYLDREEFTSEKYKIEIRGLPKFYGIKELKKLLNEKLGLGSNRVKPPKNGTKCWVFVGFRSQEAQENAISVIDGMMWKNRKLSAKKAKPSPDPLIMRKIESNEGNCNKAKINNEKEQLSPEEQVKYSTTPLWNLPYAEQLDLKQKEIKSVLVQMGHQIAKENKSLVSWIEEQKIKNDGLMCELMPILSAEVTEGYRNKCEFTIGKSVDGSEILIGFRIASYASGSTAVGPISHLCHIPESTKKAVEVFQEFVRNSGLDVFNPIDHSGNWKQLTTRTTCLNHLMLIVGIHPHGMNDEQLTKLKSEIREFFENGPGKAANVTSLYFQTIERKDFGGRGGGSIEHLSGSEYVEDKLFGMTFRVSPLAFFQVNSKGAEVLYNAAIELAKPDKDTSLLDVCCGTGTIGISFSKHCGEVLGLEMIADAIKDAKENVKKNNIGNCEFFVGKAENILKAVIHRTTKSNIIAIVDPPRAGLHQQALLALRKTKKLSKIVYISCDPKAGIKNLVELARPSSKLYIGEPFVPVKAVPVDMFPHTNHCELVILLERVSKPKNIETISE